MIRLGSSSKAAAHELWIMCSRDILFYFNTFVWTYDPRKHPAQLPFITWAFQDDALLEMDAAIGSHDLVIEKSRDMGASWLCLGVFQWRWQFRELQTFLMASRKEDYVDKAGNPDSLYWKIDFILKHQPPWLQPNLVRNKLHLRNLDLDSTIDGDSTTGDLARGGRRTGILLDEFAAVEEGHAILSSTADVTRTRIFNSTPKGTGNAFYDVVQGNTKKIRFHWIVHPEKAEGLYYDDQGLPRSPWYDKECERRSHPMEIAQELDIDYLGSDFQFFDPVNIRRLERETVRPPNHEGEIDFLMQTCEVQEFVERKGARLKLWLQLDGRGGLPHDRQYVLGADIATGTGASNSVLVVGDRRTGEKVAEFASAHVRPEELARYAVALAKWFSDENNVGAFMIWEANGPGRNFGDRIIDLGYRHIYYRTDERSLGKRKSDIPGWWATRESKVALLGDYRRALEANFFINRSAPALRECLEYVYLPSGGVAHTRSATTIDPSGARDNHGDRVTGDALCWKGIKEQTVEVKPVEERPRHCFASRRDEYLKRNRQSAMW
jgi:hypothetical protein